MSSKRPLPRPRSSRFGNVDVEGHRVARPITEVPERAVQTRGGNVSDSGLFLELVNPDANDSFIRVRALADWIAFGELALIPHGTETYSMPVE
jgi:hypothetical protein